MTSMTKSDFGQMGHTGQKVLPDRLKKQVNWAKIDEKCQNTFFFYIDINVTN